MSAGYEHELGLFQLGIAERWFTRGEEVMDSMSKLFFYYTAFNALFFYHALVHTLTRSREHEQIESLVRELGCQAWTRVSAECSKEVAFFTARAPLQKMEVRCKTDPREGDPTLGSKHRGRLRDPVAGGVDKSVALMKIIYIVRCNLCHGSKGDAGDDKDVIEHAAPVLRTVTDESIRHTRALLRAWEEDSKSDGS
jgi:hypothetical protein